MSKLSSSGQILITEMDTEPVKAIAVEPSSNDVYIDNVATVDVFASDGKLIERLGSGELSQGSGVAVSSTSKDVYVADDGADRVDVFGLEPPSVPTVESEGDAKVRATSATLSAQVDPRGESSEYHFEYGPTALYGTTLPAAGIGSAGDFEVYEVGSYPQSLTPDTEYHFRVVVENKHGTRYGNDQVFRTEGAGSAFALPDGRQWEMVSPPNKHGGLIEPIVEGVVAAADNGEAFTYLSDAPTETEPTGSSNRIQVLSTRGAGGWSSLDIATPHDTSTGPSVDQGYEYRFFSPDLSEALVEPQGGFTPIAKDGVSEEASPQASERTEYLRNDFGCQATPTTCYTPLLTAADVSSGVEYGGPPEQLTSEAVKFVGAAPDLRHVVLSANVPLTDEAPTATKGGLYEWAEGRLQLVSLLPEDEEAGGPAEGSALGYVNADARNAISSDGSRIVWQSGRTSLYMRDVAKHETVRLDVVQQGASGTGAPEPVFEAASSSGSRVFFTDTQQLTEDSHATEEEPDLYVCQMAEVAGKLKCELEDLTADVDPGERASVQDAVLGASEDGSYVYFVANGVLAPGAAPGNCIDVGAGSLAERTCNLYVAHNNGNEWTPPTFIATLANEDAYDWSANQHGMDLSELTARVSPDGRYLAFMSERQLTGYDNADVVSGQPDEEVYLYDAATGKLACASCNPTGERPTGILDEAGEGGIFPLAIGSFWQGHWIAANIPGWTPYTTSHALYQSRYLSNSGRLFFNSSDALVPLDVDGTQDVYEYEPEGTGPENARCGPGAGDGSETVKPAHKFEVEGASGEEPAGCVGLISSGGSAEESMFLDASEGGGDVFFLTTAKLSPQDLDGSYDVYDAHECTSQSPCLAPAPTSSSPCASSDACRAAPSLQPAIFGSSGSATFSGTSNPAPAPASTVESKPKPLTRAQKLAKALKACKKKPKKKRATCERQARRSYGSARKATKSHKRGK